ncbi:sensor histidine kinase [Spirochaeta isovalerica]|uniref:Sensor histidine kinase YesM n=1 Tax=Spirochaeta isovalerica TaxID=150 RepID=A0A841RBD9_9SPIO|nr:histidine kinase [Spirochaeta isovalerica]MBB6479998.1 sensor histidine kinase YesM [Spirochaeta isovalerica]
MEDDVLALSRSKQIWNDILISMNELQYNWSDGETYFQFKEQYQSLDHYFRELDNRPRKNIIDLNKTLNRRMKDLYNTWIVAREGVLEVLSAIESPDFERVVLQLERKPGLQRINHLWTELYYSSDAADNKDAYILRNVIDSIEFFPIYSETVNKLFDVIIGEVDVLTSTLRNVEILVSLSLFILFIGIALYYSFRFSNSISQPIMDLSYKLSSFVGKTLKLKHSPDLDELNLLGESVGNLISHYTDLSVQAGRLAMGELDSPILDLQEHGVVGRALKDINLYLMELAETSQWIKKGNYGARIRIKSEKDILASNFNVMSKVIDEKITTLKNIFEAVEESIIVINRKGEVLEGNSKFLQLVGLKGETDLSNEKMNLSLFFYTDDLPDELFDSSSENILYIDLKDINGEPIPVKLLSRKMPEDQSVGEQFMLFITNETLKMRMERERETLRAQAVESELMALRAQINPHFLFNTLNGIAHLIESNSDKAVIMIEKLADLFRYSLVSTRRITVLLSEELNIIKQFMDIEKMRYGDNLEVEYHIDKELLYNTIPPMLLQPIVENAVKYGSDEGGKIHIDFEIVKEGNFLIITISDRGTQAVNPHILLEQQGTGIRNVNQRMMTLYNQPVQFVQNNPGGLKVILKIPETASEFN